MTKLSVPRTEEEQAFHKAKKHPLMGKTDAQIKTYVNNNVGSLAEAKVLLAEMAMLMRDTMRFVAKRRG